MWMKFAEIFRGGRQHRSGIGRAMGREGLEGLFLKVVG
jgi:hypothetical protein